MRKLTVILGVIALIIATPLGFGVRSAHGETLSTIASLNSGELVRGESFPAVYYYGEDGFRYVFPNDKTYFTWYSNFDNVKWLSDADLGTIQIGGNVTYKPGSKMIKIDSDPKTYAVGANGALHWVTSEAVAVALYGANWNTKIDDVPDGFFSNYTMSSEVGDVSQFSPTTEGAAATNINTDKNLQAATAVSIVDFSFSPATTTIQAGTAVRFSNSGAAAHTATADDNSWGTGTLKTGQEFSRYFKTAGTYTYHCSYHPSMLGTIVVE